MSKSLNHARHNKKACDYLHSSDVDKFSDWVITTALYSAIHYVYAATFPLIDGASTYENFEKYHYAQGRIGYSGSKHDLTYSLVKKYHSEIDAQFSQLKNVANTSRYHDFEHHPDAVKRIRKCLSLIEKYCEEKITSKVKKSEEKI